jgi:hypothetical protein
MQSRARRAAPWPKLRSRERDRLLVDRRGDERGTLAALDRRERGVDRVQRDAPVLRGDLAIPTSAGAAPNARGNVELRERFLDDLGPMPRDRRW